MERYKEGLTGKGSQTANPDFKFEAPKFYRDPDNKIDLQKISELNITHPAREYLENRKIKNLETFYYCPKFKEWTNSRVKIFDTLRKDSPRIIIPLKDTEGKLFGYQGRSLSPKAKIRYITIMLDESKPKVFGLDSIKTDEVVYVTEGPFDSTFIHNSIAMCGSDVDLSSFNYKFVFIFDNEPRNKEIVSKIAKAIEQGYPVVIFPKNIVEKDINDMVMAGHDVQNMVESNTYHGLEAKLKLSEWKKV